MILHKIHFESGLLSINATGEYNSLDDVKRLFLETLEAVAQYKAQNVLFDGRRLKGKPQDLERFLYGEFAAKETMRVVKEHGFVPRFAYVIHEPVRDPGQFGETVAVNRGMGYEGVREYGGRCFRMASSGSTHFPRCRCLKPNCEDDPMALSNFIC